MKILIFIVSLFFAQEAVSQLQLQQDKKLLGEGNQFTNSENKFKIINIDSIETVYIIYAERRDSIIKIVTKKGKLNDCRPIVIGRSYDLKVGTLIENLAGKRHVGGVKYNGIIIKLEGDKVIWDLFFCENLKGLCLTPSGPCM